MIEPVSISGAVIGLLLTITLILKKVHPVYSLFIGAIAGGLLGGATLPETINLMIEGAQHMMPAVLRILAAGVLAGVLIESGAAGSISKAIINKAGERLALSALILSAFTLTAVGVFVDVAVITVAPVALALAKQLNLSKMSILLAMLGGAKSGNVISPNPNTIEAAEAFGLDLSHLMFAGLLPALAGLVMTAILARLLINRGCGVMQEEIKIVHSELPKFSLSIIAPLVAILLLAARPLFGLAVDPLIALPLGGLAGCIAMKRLRQLNSYALAGIQSMSSIAVLLIGTGAIAGIMAHSTLKDTLGTLLSQANLSPMILAPLSGILMSGATGSTVSGTAVACSVFAPSLLTLGIAPLSGAVMLHAGAGVLSHLPHGSLFHSTAGSVNMDIRQRLRLLIYETLIGLSITLMAVVVFS